MYVTLGSLAKHVSGECTNIDKVEFILDYDNSDTKIVEYNIPAVSENHAKTS